MQEFQSRPVFEAKLRRRGIYLLPNLFTTGALFAGFYAIVQAMNGRFEHSAVAIFIAMVLDGLDGRVARLTHTQSEFGAEYDSLSDMVSFGAAPSLVIYEWALKGMGKWGWIAAFIYCVCAALRLARFNTNIGVVDKRYFQGLPSPAAAALIAGLIWLMLDFGIAGADVRWLAWCITLFAGLTMVSDIPLLQRQGNQSAQVSTIHHCPVVGAVLFCIDSESSTGRAVLPVFSVFLVRLWHVDLAAAG